MELVYLDYNATTPVAPEVFEAMRPWFTDAYWNPASAHVGGRRAHEAVEKARNQMADLIGASPREIIWTAGSTEANNLAIKGAAARAPGGQVLVAATEHKAVLDTAHALENDGFKVEELSVDKHGLVQADVLARALSDDVVLVSVMLANNETGVIQPVGELSRLAHEAGALMHTDATQAAGRITVDVRRLGVDLASFSAHKFYGPKGVGCLFVRPGTSLHAQTHGGGQESGLRSGTTNVPGVIGMGAAAAFASGRQGDDATTARELIDRLVAGFRSRLPGVEMMAEDAPRLPNTANIRFLGADGEAVMANAPAILISSGSACTARVPDASHVLQAMGLSQQEAFECLRFSVGRQTTPDDVDAAIERISSAVQRVRELTA